MYESTKLERYDSTADYILRSGRRYYHDQLVTVVWQTSFGSECGGHAAIATMRLTVALQYRLRGSDDMPRSACSERKLSLVGLSSE